MKPPKSIEAQLRINRKAVETKKGREFESGGEKGGGEKEGGRRREGGREKGNRRKEREEKRAIGKAEGNERWVFRSKLLILSPFLFCTLPYYPFSLSFFLFFLIIPRLLSFFSTLKLRTKDK